MAGEEVTDSRAVAKITKGLRGQPKEFEFYSVCVRKTLEGKLRNDRSGYLTATTTTTNVSSDISH